MNDESIETEDYEVEYIKLKHWLHRNYPDIIEEYDNERWSNI